MAVSLSTRLDMLSYLRLASKCVHHHLVGKTDMAVDERAA